MSVRIGVGAVLCLGLVLPAVARADLRVDVRTDRTTLSLEEGLTLQITVQSQGTGSPRVEIPQFDGFQIISQQVQRPMQFSFSFGAQAAVQASTIYTFVLQPLRQGTLTIKPVRAELDGKVQASHPIQIMVSGGASAAAPQGQSQPQSGGDSQPTGRNNAADGAQVDPVAFVRTVVDKPTPYEGEQVTVTIYLYVRERLQSAPNVETEPTSDGLWIHDLLGPTRTLQPGRQVVGSDLYTVYVLRRFAAFPLRSGELTIGPMALEIDTSSLFDLFSPGRAQPNLKRASQPVTLHVQPLPAQGRPAGEVAVGRFALSTKLDRTQAVTGDAVTLTATVRGQGNVRSIALGAPQIKGVDVLQPEIKDLVESPNDLVSGTREYRFLLVPREPGRVSIAPLALLSFDPNTQRYQRLTSDALTFDVVGRALPSVQGPNDQKKETAAVDQTSQRAEQHAWAPIRTQSALQRGYVRLVARPFYPWALAAPALLWLAVASVGGLRRRLAKRALTGPGRAMREAEQRLSTAEAAAKIGEAPRFYAEASAALIAVLEARLAETLSGLTRVELRERLASHGLPETLAAAVLDALERSERERFGSIAGSQSELDGQAKNVHELFKQLGGFTPLGAGRAA